MTPSPGPSGSSSQQRVRRSTRLYTNNNGSVKENEKSGGKKAATPKSPRSGRKGASARASKAAALTLEMNEKNLMHQEQVGVGVVAASPSTLHTDVGVRQFLGVLGQIGQAYLHLAHYECRKAIHLLDRLSERHYKTAWVLCAKGKAFYELSDYKMAVRLYEEARELEPARLQGMEVLSTAYWYLENEVGSHCQLLFHQIQALKFLKIK
jgi:tetratricopeptide (TPR) repeat protein